MERPPLRDLYRPAEPINPALIAPNPGEMGELYVHMRQHYADGMVLACATPNIPYEQIVGAYHAERQRPDFSPEAFWYRNFTMPEFTGTKYEAAPGTSLDAYTLAIRGLFRRVTPDKNSRHIMWLPYPGLVAGVGRFSMHDFMWDGYHMLKGYAADGRPEDWQTILNTVDNTAYQIETIGYGPNGNADFYLTRAQPPYFSHEISMLADNEAYGDEALIHYLPVLEKEYLGYWMDGHQQLQQAPDDGTVREHRTLVRVPLGDGRYAYLNRYWDDFDTPRLESYLEDVEVGEHVTHGMNSGQRELRLQKLFRDLRAGAASGWDYSSRYLADGKNLASVNTTDIAPIDLNCLVDRMEQVLARAHEAAAKQAHLTDDQKEAHHSKAQQYAELAGRRAEAISRFMWDPREQVFRDYNFVEGRQTGVISAAMSYPLYVGIASPAQAFGVANTIEKQLLRPGGVITTTSFESRQQWDGDNVWAPTNWATARGLGRMAHMLQNNTIPLHAGTPYANRNNQSRYAPERLLDLAHRARLSFMTGIEAVYAAQGVVPEKHSGANPSQLGGGGEYDVVKILGMPSEIYRALRNWDPTDRHGTLPIGPLILPQYSLVA